MESKLFGSLDMDVLKETMSEYMIRLFHNWIFFEGRILFSGGAVSK